MIRRILPVALLGLLLALWLYGDQLWPAETVSGNNITIRDGDTLIVSEKIFRLSGIDAPEYHQTCGDTSGKEWPCGKVAREKLVAIAAKQVITCVVRATDKYHRSIATCGSTTVPDLSAAMVSAGLAISPAERGVAAYNDEQAHARTSKIGIWQGTFIDPVAWRAAHPRAQTDSGSALLKAKAGND